jgi:transposase-like protein
MTQQRRFTKEFAEEALRLVQTSGRTQREIAGDLGIGLSTPFRPRLHKPGSVRKNGRRLNQSLSTKPGQVQLGPYR